MDITTTRQKIRIVGHEITDNLHEISDHELSVIYNDLSKLSDILLDKLINIQKEKEALQIC